MKTASTELPPKYLDRLLNGWSSPSEHLEFRNWLKASDENRKGFAQALNQHLALLRPRHQSPFPQAPSSSK